MWVNDKPLDYEYRSVHVMLILEILVLELWIEANVYGPHSFLHY